MNKKLIEAKVEFEKRSRELRYSFIETPTDEDMEGLRRLAVGFSQSTRLSSSGVLYRMSALAKCGADVGMIERQMVIAMTKLGKAGDEKR